MKANFLYFSLFFWVFSVQIGKAQTYQDVTGVISDEQGMPLKSATVFISGTQRLTIVDDNGRFILPAFNRGTYNVSVSMMGYVPYNANVIVKDSSIHLTISLKPKAILLNEVIIGSGDKWTEFYRVFLGQFLGTSKSAEACTILNPKALSFDYNKKTGLLTAHAERFLIIDNTRLGYRIRYLLKHFNYSALNNRTIYDGDTHFEPLEGTDSRQKVWARNQLEAYNGSMLHFLRSVFANAVLANGFITNKLLTPMPASLTNADKLMVDARLLSYDTLTTRLETAFIQFKAPVFYLVYNPKKASGFVSKQSTNRVDEISYNDETGTIVKLSLETAIIDKRGSYTDYRAFLIHGNLAKRRVSDMLPLEYQPPRNDK
jgi:hypothetical protein